MMAAIALSWRIFRRTIGAKYRKSFLGYFWMIAPALLITGGVALARQAVAPGSSALQDSLAVFLGTLLWQVFAEAIDVPHQAFEGARSYLTRVHFSRAAIVLAQLYESLLTAGVRLVAVLVVFALTNGIDAWFVVLGTACFYGAVLLGLGIGALLMPFTQLFADLHQTMRLLLGYGLFLTPALYPPLADGWWKTIVHCNPVTPLIVAATETANGLPLSQPTALVLTLTGGVLATMLGLLLVRAVAPIIIERMLLGGR